MLITMMGGLHTGRQQHPQPGVHIMDRPLDLLTTRTLGRAKDTETAGQVARKDGNMTD